MTARSRSMADELLDELLPGDFDWEGLVSRHPRICLLAAGAAGFWLGYRRGTTALGLLGTLVTSQVAGTVGDLLGGD